MKLKTNKANVILLCIIADAIFIIVSYLLTILVARVIGGNASFPKLPYVMLFVIAYKVVIFAIFGTYRMMLRYLSLLDIIKTIILIVAGNVGLVILLFIPGIPIFMHKSLYLHITTFEVILLVGYRVAVKFIYYVSEINAKKGFHGINTLIVGAGSAGELALQEINVNKEIKNFVVGFVDDDQEKQKKTISNKPVLGKISDLSTIIEKYNVEVVILAINNFPQTTLNKVINEVNNFPQVKVKKISVITDLNESEKLKISDVKVEDLLERSQIILDNDELSDFINNEVVLVTGGGGSIGSELSRQIFALNPKQLIIFDIYENNAYEIQMELERLKYKDKSIKTKITVLIGSVYNEVRLNEVFELNKPSIVFHAAAYKHVPLMEESPVEAIRTNVLGTNNLAKLACKHKVKKVVLVSSDKAVRSTNVMGATKRYAELIISHYNTISDTKFSAVRFGNVLGSNGSVIPLFKKQIEDGGPITVTHKEITRYFMTIPEAVGLILQSAVYAKGGEIFILDMGSPVKIYDLAMKMIMLSGLRPLVDIDIEIVGLRPGEKLYEELLVDLNSNNFLSTDHSRIFVEKQEELDFKRLDIEYVINNFEKFDNEHIKEMLARVIESYQINGDKNV